MWRSQAPGNGTSRALENDDAACPSGPGQPHRYLAVPIGRPGGPPCRLLSVSVELERPITFQTVGPAGVPRNAGSEPEAARYLLTCDAAGSVMVGNRRTPRGVVLAQSGETLEYNGHVVGRGHRFDRLRHAARRRSKRRVAQDG